MIDRNSFQLYIPVLKSGHYQYWKQRFLGHQQLN